jgi:hypothetical protein
VCEKLEKLEREIISGARGNERSQKKTEKPGEE